MARAPKKTTSDKKPIEQYEHKGKKRLNNPPVGLVTPATDQEEPKKSYSYDPHLDPQLVWAGKKERTCNSIRFTWATCSTRSLRDCWAGIGL